MKWSEVVEQNKQIEIYIDSGWKAPAGHGSFGLGEEAYHSDDYAIADAGLVLSPIYIGYENATTPKENSIYFYGEIIGDWAIGPYEQGDIVLNSDKSFSLMYLLPSALSYDFIKWCVQNNAYFSFISGEHFTVELDEEQTVPPVEQLRKLVVDTCDAIRTKKGTTAKINTNDIPSEILSIGGSGGDNTPKYVTVTITNTNKTYTAEVYYKQGELIYKGILLFYIGKNSSATTTLQVGTTIGIYCDTPGIPRFDVESITGDIVDLGSQEFMINGDGTITGNAYDAD